MTRAVYAVYVLVVSVFVVASIAQVARALFGGTEAPAGATASRPNVKAACGRLIDEQGHAIERARLAASDEPNGEAARARYETERKASRERARELDQSCADEPNGMDALAALARFDRAAESHAIRTAAELSPVRLAAQSFIRGDLP